ncbi:MAG: lysostaphin resistance A-like protein [Halorhabdus sp.]
MDDLYRYADFQTRLQGAAHALGVILAAFVVGAIVLPLLIAPLVDPFVPIYAGESLTSEGYLLLSAVQFVGFIAVAIGYVIWQDADLVSLSVPSLRDLAWMGGGFVLLFLVAYGLSVLITLLDLETATNSVVQLGREDPRIFLYMIPISFLFIGPGEELVFRGVVQGLFRKAYGVAPAVLITSVLFGVAHYLALVGQGRATYIAIAIGLGVVLGSVYERTENVLVPIVIHGAWNAMLFTIQWYVATNPELAESLAVLP